MNIQCLGAEVTLIFSNFNFNNKEPIYLQIEKYIRHLLESGLIIAGGKLPATREMSKLLGVSRNSIITAYENLEASNIVYTIKGKGTFITENKTNSQDEWKLCWEEKTNIYGQLAEDLDIVKNEIPWKKGLISFKSISPEGELFNMEEFKRAFLNRISIEEDKLLNYGYAKGYKPLIEYLLNYMESKGIKTDNKDILITNGFTEGFEMLISSYTNKGDSILCEDPTHNTAIKIMKVHELNIIGIEMRKDGLDLDKLEQSLSKDKIKFGYLIPSYHNPTGIIMDGEKRNTIYKMFKKHNVPIIEDGFNEELLYNSTHISPIAALDKNNNGVVYIGSFSKILFPGIRIGWILGDRKMISTLESVKRCKNIHTSFLDQGILYEYLKNGDFEKHVKKTRRFYKERYNFALECINKYLKPSSI